MGNIIDRALSLINDNLKDQTSSFSDPVTVKPMARGGRLLEDEYPTQYMPHVGRQVMAAGGEPEDPVAAATGIARDVAGGQPPIPGPVAPRPRVSPFEGRVKSTPLASTFDVENRPGVVVSPRPGKGGGPSIAPEPGVLYEQPGYEGYGARGEEPTSSEPFGPSTPDIMGAPLPPPVQHPLQNEPRLQKVSDDTQRLFRTPGFRKLLEDHVGLRGPLSVMPTVGTWKNEMEPSFILQHPDMDEEKARRLAHILGFGFQQDAVVHAKHNPDLDEGIPALLIGNGKKLKPEHVDQIAGAAKKEGLDFTVTGDGKAAKFLHFGGDDSYDGFLDSVNRVADAANMNHRYHARTQGDLIDAKDYLNGIFGGAGEGEGLPASAERSPDLFGRIVNHVLAPYAKAVASEGYRLSPERLAQTFGLTQDEETQVREALYPSAKGDRTTVPLMSGAEDLDVRPTGARGNATVNDVLYALQNRAAKYGQIDPGDYSDRAKKLIASDIADEVKYHVDNSDKSAVGWYDAALKKAKDMYHEIFPELKTDKDKEMLFDAILGITSQGNDVHSNSVFAARVYDKMRNEGKSIAQATKELGGGFGAQTKAIEGNLMKLHHLLDQNGYDRMRDLFNQKKTVSEWNKILRTDPTLKVPGQEQLKMQGAGDQNVTGWMVFGPKIGSFINNLHGDYSTLTADLWFSRTWNRLLGHNFIHTPLAEQKQYQDFRDAIKAEFLHHNGLPHEQYAGKTSEGQYQKDAAGNVKPWTFGNDMKDMSHDEFHDLINDPEKMQELAGNLYEQYKGGGFKDKSDARRRAKNWMENRDLPVAAPRGDKEREFQQNTVEDAQKLLKKKYGLDISIADIQAALWFHEKELFGKLGVAPERAQPADYADAAKNAMELIKKGELYRVKSKEKKPAKAYGGAINPIELRDDPEDMARRLILWSYAVAPIGRPLARAEGGAIDDPVNQALSIAGAPQQSDAQKAVETARNLTPMGFYSAAAEAASTIPQRAPIDQILNKVKGSPNVKAEEFDWSGVRDAFAGQKSVDPKEVARHFQENLPQIQETVKYDPTALAEMMHRERQSLLVQGRTDEAAALKDKITETYNPFWRGENAAKYDVYTIPDGENYREVLLHLPSEYNDLHKQINQARQDRIDAVKEHGSVLKYDDPALEQKRLEKIKEATKRENDLRDKLKNTPKELTYQSSHWNVPNVVAHLRMSDRREPMGGKILHIEEIQSDWGQEGRSQGFDAKKGLDAAEQKELDDLIAIPMRERTNEQMSRFNQLVNQRSKISMPSIPSAPHVTSTESWTDLALKRALREAAEGGYKKLVWTPGKEQSARYNLSHHVNNILYDPKYKTLSAYKPDGSSAFEKTNIGPEQLPQYIGKEVAERLLQTTPTSSGYHRLGGEELDVGGEGMQGFYDRLVPQRLKKLIAKLDPNAKIGKSTITTRDDWGTVDHDVHSLEITPRMRAAILKGLPAYEHGGSVVDRAFDVLSRFSR